MDINEVVVASEMVPETESELALIESIDDSYVVGVVGDAFNTGLTVAGVVMLVALMVSVLVNILKKA